MRGCSLVRRMIPSRTYRLNPGACIGEPVRARDEVGHVVRAFRVGFAVVDELRFGIDDIDGRSGNDGAGIVGHGSDKRRGAGRLGEGDRDE